MSDGSRLRQSWYSALNDAEAQFKNLLTLPAAEWKRISNPVDGSASKQKGKTKVSSLPDLSDVALHRALTKVGEGVYRMVLDVPTGEEQLSLEPWKAVLTTPELRSDWDPAVEDAHLVEVFDHVSRICKTNYTLGWPANPRDSITISRAFHDTTTLIDITTSLPRSPDEPAYLRPSPPFVRSHVHLFAWCIQHTHVQGSSLTDTKKSTKGGRLRLTCFWQHDLKALWGFGLSTSALAQQLSTMTLSLFKTVVKRGGRVAKLAGYGNGISVERMRYQIDREALVLDYAVIPDDDDHHETGLQGMDEVHALREHRRLTRSIECVLPTLEGWDVQLTLKGSSEDVEKVPWSAHAMRNESNESSLSPPGQIRLRITHGALTDNDAVLKVKVVVEVSGATKGLRVNGLASTIHDVEDRDPSSRFIPQKILQDVVSAVDLSFQTSTSSLATTSTGASSSTGQPLIRSQTERSQGAEKSIQSKIRRNYIYFSSLLQEPEAKWRRTTEARGVSITQLDSIDPTLVVYRAEATFVGVNLWDLYATVISPGARVFWDKQHEDDTLLEDINEMSELWHFKTKPAWPVTGRDAVLLKTVYKSPTTIHVFYFSVEDPHLFPGVPPADPNVIRTQVDLQGWAIESLSPTTTLLTLLEQSDPKGWTGKTSIPTQMINTMAGIGEFSIKCGGPPIVTRLAGAKANDFRYDHEKGSFKVEYEPSRNRRLNNNGATSDDHNDGSLPTIELELRCDIDTWGASLDIVVDPPPQTISCLRRHRLSTEGGGLWLTLTHDSILMDDERLLTIVRRAPGKEKGLVMVNGAKISVDVEEIPDHEIKSLTRQKRIKPPRIPLDQPPVIGVIRRRKAEWNGGISKHTSLGLLTADSNGNEASSSWASAPKMPSPLARFWSYAVDQATTTTQQAVAAIAPATYSGGIPTLDPTKLPMQYVLEALAWAQEFNSKPQTDGWMVIYEKGITLHKKLIPEVSPYIPVHRGVKVIEGVSAGELMSIILESNCRKTWDERYDSSKLLELYGGQAQTAFFVAKAGFPFRDRGFYLASVVARPFSASPSSRRSAADDSERTPSARNTIFCVSASFSPESAKGFSPEKYNPHSLPIGRMYVDAWILETLDPYTTENYAIPSTRCTRLVAVDYAGSIPAAVNSMINAALARSVLGVEAYMKSNVKAALPVTRLPAPGVMISDKRPEEGSGAASSTSGTAISGGDLLVAAPFMAWKLRKKDESQLLLETKFDVERVVYRNSVLIRLPPRWGSRREASNATIDNSAQSTGTTPRPSRLMLSKSPQREPPALPDVSLDHAPNSSVISPTRGGSSVVLNTPMMPGSMIRSTSPPNNAGGLLSGLPPLRSPTTSTFQSNTEGSSTIMGAGTNDDGPQPLRTSLPSSVPARTRQRAASSGSALLSESSQGHTHTDGSRGRTTTLAFMPKGDVRHNTDLVVMELVIDSKLFRAALNGAKSRYQYVVDVRARPRKSETIALGGAEMVGNGITSTLSSLPSSTNGPSSPQEYLELPFAYTVHTMPSSPSHSSELSSEAPSRHLLRVTLPTAQYFVNSFWDPLAGEMRDPPPKPEWMKILEGGGDQDGCEGKQGGNGEASRSGIVVEAVVRRWEGEPNEKDSKLGSVGSKKTGKDNARGRQVVLINGKEVGVVGEKESLTSLGRDELLDDRVAKMGVLSRIPNESEPLPVELKAPIGISEDLLLPASSAGADTSERSASAEDKSTDDESVKGKHHNNGSETPSNPNMEVGHIGDGTIPGNRQIGEPHAQHAALSAGESGLAGGGGLLGFLQGYPNPLLMKFGFSARASGDSGLTDDSSGSEKGKDKDKAIPTETPNRMAKTSESSSNNVIGVAKPADGGSESSGHLTQQQQTIRPTTRTTRGYSLSTLVFVGLIAFLIGSLLRSLLSPADFIYVVGDETDVRSISISQFGGDGEWREIRRLLEIKYLFGGWDFQIAVVHRHN